MMMNEIVHDDELLEPLHSRREFFSARGLHGGLAGWLAGWAGSKRLF